MSFVKLIHRILGLRKKNAQERGGVFRLLTGKMLDAHDIPPLTPSRVVSIGSQGYIMNAQEPDGDILLPVDDTAWVSR